jgi:hypothetical protein
MTFLYPKFNKWKTCKLLCTSVANLCVYFRFCSFLKIWNKFQRYKSWLVNKLSSRSRRVKCTEFFMNEVLGTFCFISKTTQTFHTSIRRPLYSHSCKKYSLFKRTAHWLNMSCFWAICTCSLRNISYDILSYVLCQLCSKPADQKHVDREPNVSYYSLTHIRIISPVL